MVNLLDVLYYKDNIRAKMLQETIGYCWFYKNFNSCFGILQGIYPSKII